MVKENTMTQNLKKGMKQTEIGWIPQDWEVVDFLSVLKFLSTATYSRADLKQTGNIGYIHYGDIHTKFNFHLDINNFVSGYIQKDQLMNYSIIEEGDLIIADASEDYEGVGKGIEVISKPLYPVIAGLHTYLIRENKFGTFAKGFKGYFQSNPLIKKQYDALATGLKVYSLSKSIFNHIQIPLPPLAEQEAIATALSDCDGWIDSLEKVIAKKRLIKQGTMQELLTPPSTSSGTVTNGELVEPWEVKKLGEVIEKCTTGKLDANAMVENGDYRFYTCAKNYYFINDYAFDDEALLISGNGANVGYIHYFKGKFNAYQRTYVLTGFRINAFFLKVVLDKNLKDRISIEVSAGNTPYIKMDTITEMAINYPKSLSEQTRIAEILSDMDNEIEVLEQQLEKARQMKQGMMQELLTGRVRLIV